MAIIRELKLQSIVVLAQNFNPSVFNRHWLIKNNFVLEDAVLPNSIFTPAITQLSTSGFNLVVVPEQLQFNVGSEHENFEEAIITTLIPILDRLQEIPYRAVGLNFNWFITDTERRIQDLTKDLFFVPTSEIHKQFETENSRFGSYLSMDFKKSRLKLDVKPINSHDRLTNEVKEHILFSFNFHIQLDKNDSAKDLLETMKDWKEYKDRSEHLINLL